MTSAFVVPDQVLGALDGLGVFASGGTKELAFARFKNLYCQETEGVMTADKFSLRFTLDTLFDGLNALLRGELLLVLKGLLPGVAEALISDPTQFLSGNLTFGGDIDDAQEKEINLLVPLLPGRWFHVELWDMDTLDPDDPLGAANLRQSSAEPDWLEQDNGFIHRNQIGFNGDGAQYWLRYEIVRLPVQGGAAPAPPGVLDHLLAG